MALVISWPSRVCSPALYLPTYYIQNSYGPLSLGSPCQIGNITAATCHPGFSGPFNKKNLVNTYHQ